MNDQIDKLDFSQVYFLIGVIRGRTLLTGDKELHRIALKLEEELNKALKYEISK